MLKSILIVEDSTDHQNLLKILLEREGYTVHQAYDGLQALEVLKSLPQLPHVILLDVMMPVMDAFGFREEQKKNPDFSQIPVLMMTADANPEAKAQKLGVQKFIRKPIRNIDEFLNLIDSSRN